MVNLDKENKELFQKTKAVLKQKSYDFNKSLTDIGFEFHTDESDDEDRIEEQQAIPDNNNDKLLDTYYFQ